MREVRHKRPYALLCFISMKFLDMENLRNQPSGVRRRDLSTQAQEKFGG